MSKISSKPLISKTIYWLVIVISFMIILLLSSLLIINIRVANHQGILQRHRSISELLIQHQKNGVVIPADVSYIDYWMTFKYIEVTFKLPENYLKGILNISDKKYPNIPLGRYADANTINRAIFITDVKQAVSSYLTINSTQK